MRENVGLIVLGLILMVIGLSMAVGAGFETNSFTDETEVTPLFYIGLLVAGVGGVMTAIGTIAVGVQYGLKGAREDSAGSA